MNGKFDDLVELGEFYILSQKFEEAIKVLKKAEKINKLSPKLYYNLGIVYETLNEKDKAVVAFRQAVSLDPNLKSAQEHLERLIKE